MDPKVLMNENITHGYSKNQKSKKGIKSNKTAINSYHGHYGKNTQYVNNTSYGHHGAYNYPSWTVFDEIAPVRKGSYNQNSGKSSYVKNSHKVNAYNYTSASDKAGWSTQTGTASENETNLNNELVGFKIAQGGKVIHNEAQDEIFGEELDSTVYSNYFAASVMTIGPNSDDISLPSFL